MTPPPDAALATRPLVEPSSAGRDVALGLGLGALALLGLGGLALALRKPRCPDPEIFDEPAPLLLDDDDIDLIGVNPQEASIFVAYRGGNRARFKIETLRDIAEIAVAWEEKI